MSGKGNEMDQKDKTNGTFLKVVACVMGAVTLISVGWASSSTMGLFDARELDERGTQQAIALEGRVEVLEKTLDLRMAALDSRSGWGISTIIPAPNLDFKRSSRF